MSSYTKALYESIQVAIETVVGKTVQMDRLVDRHQLTKQEQQKQRTHSRQWKPSKDAKKGKKSNWSTQGLILISIWLN